MNNLEAVRALGGAQTLALPGAMSAFPQLPEN